MRSDFFFLSSFLLFFSFNVLHAYLFLFYYLFTLLYIQVFCLVYFFLCPDSWFFLTLLLIPSLFYVLLCLYLYFVFFLTFCFFIVFPIPLPVFQGICLKFSDHSNFSQFYFSIFFFCMSISAIGPLQSVYVSINYVPVSEPYTIMSPNKFSADARSSNEFKDEAQTVYLKTQFVSRSKHFSSRL